mgnify:CR=1 FL=1
MNTSLLIAFITFSFISGITPGPNNLIALASGANYGYRRTLPHVLGVVLGFNVVYLLMGAGLGTIFSAFPLAKVILQWGCLLYIFFLAWKIASAKGPGNFSGKGVAAKPVTFAGSVGFQWINAKVWVATLTLVSTYTDPEAYWASLFIGSLVNALIAFTTVSTWALFGTLLRRFLEHPLRRRVFNIAMALILVASVVPSLLIAH